MDHFPGATVFVVDDDADVRNMILGLVESIGLRAECFPSADDFLKAYHPRRPGCLVTDVRLPGMSGLELQESLAHQSSLLPVIVITGHADVPLAVRAMKSHAVDLLEKPFNTQELLDRIQHALRLDTERRCEQAATARIASRVATLTPREREVMDLVVRGLANKQIAYQLGLSEKTVETHRSRVMKKLSVSSVADLVRLSIGLNGDDAIGRAGHRRVEDRNLSSESRQDGDSISLPRR